LDIDVSADHERLGAPVDRPRPRYSLAKRGRFSAARSPEDCDAAFKTGIDGGLLRRRELKSDQLPKRRPSAGGRLMHATA
jgi:hypothetical protein